MDLFDSLNRLSTLVSGTFGVVKKDRISEFCLFSSQILGLRGVSRGQLSRFSRIEVDVLGLGFNG